MSYFDLRRWKKTIQSDKKMLKFVEEKHVGQIRKGRAFIACEIHINEKWQCHRQAQRSTCFMLAKHMVKKEYQVR